MTSATRLMDNASPMHSSGSSVYAAAMRATLVLLVLMGCSSAPTKLVYPTTRRGADVETHRGVAVADPYRWLEAMDSAETKAWVAAQNQLVDRYLAQRPGRTALHARLEQLFSVESTRAPLHRGGRYFWRHKDGKRDQPTIEMATSIDGAAITVLDAIPSVAMPCTQE